jgi:hypothetical protein
MNKLMIAKALTLFSVTFVVSAFVVRPYVANADVTASYTGQCGYVNNPRHSARAPNQAHGDTALIGDSGIIDFDAMTIRGAATKWTVCSGCDDAFDQVAYSAPVTMTTDPEVDGAIEISYVIQGFSFKTRLIAVNDGNAFIFQNKLGEGIGVCNKI